MPQPTTTPSPCPAAQRAIQRIKTEHHALARIIAAMQVWVSQAREGRSSFDLDLFEAMLRYIEEVPDSVHHPREDDTLFPAVAAVPEGREIVADLEREHARCTPMLADLKRAYRVLQHGGPNALNRLSSALDAFADFYRAHMRKEEERLLPFAAAKLSEPEWERIDAAFAKNTDPLFGSALTEKYRRLYEYITENTKGPLKDYLAALTI